MNWKQLHIAANHQERLEIIIHMLHAIETSQRRLIFILPRSIKSILMAQGWVIVQERRHPVKRMHFINDRRNKPSRPSHPPKTQNYKTQGFTM